MDTKPIVEELAEIIARLEANFETVAFRTKSNVLGNPSKPIVDRAMASMQSDFDRLKELQGKLT